MFRYEAKLFAIRSHYFDSALIETTIGVTITKVQPVRWLPDWRPQEPRVLESARTFYESSSSKSPSLYKARLLSITGS